MRALVVGPSTPSAWRLPDRVLRHTLHWLPAPASPADAAVVTRVVAGALAVAFGRSVRLDDKWWDADGSTVILEVSPPLKLRDDLVATPGVTGAHVAVGAGLFWPHAYVTVPSVFWVENGARTLQRDTSLRQWHEAATALHVPALLVARGWR